MRPIDADDLKQYICETCEQHERCKDTENVCSTIADIDEQPTLDVEPVKHSKWIPIDHTNDAFCENCGCERGSKAWNKDDFNICQNCGAKMDGD